MRLRRSIILVSFALIAATAFWCFKNPRVNLPENTVLLGVGGNALWYDRPHAATFDCAAWVGYMTDQREVKVARVSGGKTIEAFTLFRWHYLDDHGAPAVAAIQDTGGHIRGLAIFALHHSPIYLSQWDSDSEHWTEARQISSSKATYPQVVQTNDGVVHLFFRQTRGEGEAQAMDYVVMRSYDAGENWSDPETIVKAEVGFAIYGMVAAEGNRLYLGYSVARVSDMVIRGLFWKESEDAGLSWTSGNVPNGVLFRENLEEEVRLWDLRAAESLCCLIVQKKIKGKWETSRLLRKGAETFATSLIGTGSEVYYAGGCVVNPSDVNQVLLGENIEGVPGISLRSYSEERGWQISQSWRSKGMRLTRPQFLPAASGLTGQAILVDKYENFMSFKTHLVGLREVTSSN